MIEGGDIKKVSDNSEKYKSSRRELLDCWTSLEFFIGLILAGQRVVVHLAQSSGYQ